ncbi:MAG TPA: hypothetical protein DEO70_13080 [Bacteroidales bacterium]|nr:MAG: hypothetical protein A2X11_06190 [Bacteroidetes bacterium GWE2_42_24]PKP20848.1 MAG: hypothetical protein CVU06_10355 [Bacteroidetes bacterium HGW-Bacteroidetes-22]HBZ67760.1 hypothetical protein [Bacteroidales bacterium]
MSDPIFGRKISNDRNLEIILINDFNSVDIRKLAIYDALILDYTDRDGCSRFVRQCRNSMIGTIYLMPIFILSINHEIDKVMEAMSDGVVSSVQIEAIISRIDRIRLRQDQLVSVDSSSPDIRILTKAMRFMFTRETRLTPVVDHKSHIGYNFPVISDHYDQTNLKEMFQLFETATEKEYFRSRFVDKLHVCSSCYSSFLNFRETCPKCESADLVTENLIHHFVCAYVGPEHDFLSGDYLVCPKCNRMLRHIGVDYDKPSLIYNCKNCSHVFQEPVMEAFCFVCKKNNSIDSLIDVPIYSYELTPIGEETAQNGPSRDVAEDVSIPGFITATTFNIFLKYEIERAKTSKESAAGSLVIRLSPRTRENMGSNYNRMMLEIADFVKNATLSTDILSLVNSNTFLFISPETNRERLDGLINQIKGSVIKLLESSLPGIDIEISVQTVTIDGSLPQNDVLTQLIGSGR